MIASLESYLKVVEPHLGKNLCSTNNLSHIKSFATNLPLSTIAGLECRLDSQEERVDLLINLPCIIPEVSPQLQNIDHWDKFTKFCTNWSKSCSKTNRLVGHLWLEFDVLKTIDKLPFPCIFLALLSNSILDLKDILFDWPFNINHSILKNLNLCIDSLPVNSHLAHIGAMLSRQHNYIRIVITGLSTKETLKYLAKIGHPIINTNFKYELFSINKLTSTTVISLDIGNDISANLGLECYVNQPSFSHQNWEPILNYLVKKELCTDLKKVDLLNWPGIIQKSDCPELWPKHLLTGDAFLKNKSLSIVFRALNHIKLTYKSNGSVSAKAYLAFGHKWCKYERSSSISFNPDKLNLSNTNENNPSYIQHVRKYYDQMNKTITKYVGKTYQSGILNIPDCIYPFISSNLQYANRAGVCSGQNILDAGCGVCGPSIDIAESFNDVNIYAITISPSQVEVAKKFISDADLSERIHIYKGDFHELPFPNNFFDLVFFFESAGYSYNPLILFTEVMRVLRPGAKLYIKEPFIKEDSLSEREIIQIREFSKNYVYKIRRMSEMTNFIKAAGFIEVKQYDLSDLINTEVYQKAMFSYNSGDILINEFGEIHGQYSYSSTIKFGEIHAFKPN